MNCRSNLRTWLEIAVGLFIVLPAIARAESIQPSADVVYANTVSLENGMQTTYELARYGFSWTRPLHYNVLDESVHNILPTAEQLPLYQQTWRTKLEQSPLPLAHVQTIEVWNEPTNEIGPMDNGRLTQFVDMVRATREGTHAADPSIRIAVNWE